MPPQLVTITSFQWLKLNSLGESHWISPISSHTSLGKAAAHFFLRWSLEVACTLPPFVSLSPAQKLFQMLCQSHCPGYTPVTAPFPQTRATLSCVPTLPSSHRSFLSPSVKQNNPTWSCICPSAWMLFHQISTGQLHGPVKVFCLLDYPIWIP